MPITPIKDPAKQPERTSVSLPVWMWERLKLIAKEEEVTRDALMEHFLAWSIETYDKEKAEAKKVKR